MPNKSNSTCRQSSMPSFFSLKRSTLHSSQPSIATAAMPTKHIKSKKHSPYKSKSHPYSYQNPKYRAELLSQLYAIVDSDDDEAANADEDEGYVSA
nr:TPA: hypothetical protein [Oryctes rhinoceros nudivirus]